MQGKIFLNLYAHCPEIRPARLYHRTTETRLTNAMILRKPKYSFILVKISSKR